jgi:hypothetical protein
MIPNKYLDTSKDDFHMGEKKQPQSVRHTCLKKYQTKKNRFTLNFLRSSMRKLIIASHWARLPKKVKNKRKIDDDKITCYIIIKDDCLYGYTTT